MDSEWSDWADWEKCSKKCGEGGGVQIRRRSLAPLSLYGVKDCIKEDFEVRPCNTLPCKYDNIKKSEY